MRRPHLLISSALGISEVLTVDCLMNMVFLAETGYSTQRESIVIVCGEVTRDRANAEMARREYNQPRSLPHPYGATGPRSTE